MTLARSAFLAAPASALAAIALFGCARGPAATNAPSAATSAAQEAPAAVSSDEPAAPPSTASASASTSATPADAAPAASVSSPGSSRAETVPPDARASVHSGPPTDAGQIAWLRGDFRRCYQQALLGAPSLAAKGQVTIVVGLDGVVTSATLHASPLPDALRECILSKAKSRQFDARSHGVSTLVIPIAFTP